MTKLAIVLAGVMLLVGVVLVVPGGDGSPVSPARAAAPPATTAAKVSPAKRRAAKRARLSRFRSCASLLRYARRHGSRTLGSPGIVPFVRGTPVAVDMREGAPGSPQPVAAPAPGAPAQQDSSRTNVQEEGVDEPDIVKTDGNRIFALQGSTLHAIDARAQTPRLLGSLEIEGGFGAELLLDGDRVLVVSQPSFGGPIGIARAASVPYHYSTGTLLTEVDVSNPAAMRIVRTLKLDGTYLSSRLNGHTARVVIASSPRVIALAESAPGATRSRTRSRIRRSEVSGWLPSSVLRTKRTGRRVKKRAVACRSVARPASFAGVDMVTVLTIRMDKGLDPVDSDALMTDAQTVYASPKSLYVATQRWLPLSSTDERPPDVTTAIHRFDISDSDSTVYRSTGVVPGFLLNQWSLSEYKGNLRVASTNQPAWWGGRQARESESELNVLDDQSGALVPIGRVGGLGRGERIYAVRFIDDVGFIVTFRQIDPLYTIDLATPTRPRVLGELKIAGYSAYLHPVGKDLLLGVGQDATEEGRTKGTQLSLFDVSDLRNPVRVSQRALGQNASSEAEFDHHAFLYWAPTRLAMLPVAIYGDGGPEPQPQQGAPSQQGFQGAIGFRIERSPGIGEVGRVTHENNGGQGYPQVRRSLVIGDRVFTLSYLGLMASRLDTLARVAWVGFPEAP